MIEQALLESRKLDTKWIEGGFELIGEKAMREVLDIYPLIEVDISVTITIKLSDKIYVVPLEDVSNVAVNDSLTISLEDLYSDWEERIYNNITNEVKVFCGIKDDWNILKYIGLDGKSRIIKTLLN